MSKLLPTLLVSALALCIAPGAAQADRAQADRAQADRSITRAPIPRWIDQAGVDYQRPASPDAVAIYMLLVDEQRRGAGARTQVYFRSAKRILTREGVDMASAVTASFDPSYQRVAVHFVRVIRDGTVREVFEPRAVRLEALATSSDTRSYTGRERLTFLIPDLRVGDAVDFAYTITGANPVFGEHTFGTVEMWSSWPTARRRARVLAPAGTPLRLDVPEGVIERRGRAGTLDEYLFERLDGPALDYDATRPAWQDQLFTVRYSDFASWDEVALWAAGLFRPATASDAAIRVLATDIRATHATDRDRLRAALRFVQDDIRYVAISMGESSHRPHPAADVLAQRFGDCKDKSVLLASVLDELGIEATPALVSTTEGPALGDQVPSPYAFDHVIVRARLLEPQGLVELWLDPTVTSARGTDLAPPPFHRGLLAVAVAGGLRQIPFPTLADPAIDLEESFELAAPGEPSTLTVVTRMRGPEANTLRRKLGWQSPAELGEEWRKLYLARFEDLESLAPIEIEDDEVANEITVREQYRMTTFWVDGLRDVLVGEVSSQLYRPEADRRPGPLALTHPVHVRHTVRLRQDSRPISIEPAHHRVDNEYFSYDFDARTVGRTLVVVASYRSKAQEVPATDVPAYTAAVDDALDHNAYPLQWGPQDVFGEMDINWWFLGTVTALLLAGFGWFAVRTLRPLPAPAPAAGAVGMPPDPYRTAAPPPPRPQLYDIVLPPPSNGDATAALVLGICGFVLCLVPFFGALSCLTAIFWSRRGTARAHEIEGIGAAQAIAGLVLGIAGLVVMALWNLRPVLL